MKKFMRLLITHFKSVWGINTLDAREDGSSDSATFHFIIDETKDWYDIKSIVNEKTKDSTGKIVPIHKECFYSYNGEKYISTDSLSFYASNKINNDAGNKKQDNPWKVSGINSQGKLIIPSTWSFTSEPQTKEGIGNFDIEKVRRAVAESPHPKEAATDTENSGGYTGVELEECITGLMAGGMGRDQAESICKSSEGKKVMEQGRQMLRQ